MKTGILGAVSMAVYCISTALSAVWVMVAFTRISGAALTFITFLMAWAVFFSWCIPCGVMTRFVCCARSGEAFCCSMC
nr:hypothetical protein GCM10020185_76240 [Pseudomonas brassicacearum subsp. brassicacearum]